MQKLQNKIQLVTYADSLGGDLKTLKSVVDEYFSKAIGGIHILPFYPSSSNRSFSFLDQTQVDSKFGTWKDISSIGECHELVVDLMVNHISRQSSQFQDYLQKGDGSEYANWFITAEKFSRRIDSVSKRKWLTGKGLRHLEKITNFIRRSDFVFHQKGVNKFSLKKIYRPRPGNPFVEFAFGDGVSREIWCTFSDNQIDLDIRNEGVRKMFADAVEKFASHGAKLLRLDAVGYAAKRRGTDNFLIDDTLELIEWLGELAHAHGMKVLPEIHSRYENQIILSRLPQVDHVYDFALPILLLRAIYSGDSGYLKKWIEIRPKNQITTLDTHDGIGIIDVAGLMPQGEIDNTVTMIKEYGGNASMRATGNGASNVDIYQINITYFSAVGADERKYLLARAVQFFLPGIPQVFYVGALAGENDEARLEKTGIGREIMRHNYTKDEIEWNCSRQVVKDLLRLMEFRNSHSAFNGDFSMKNSEPEKLVLRWDNEDAFCELYVDFVTHSASMQYSDPETGAAEIYQIS